ncbi:MAG: hypothetical protein PWP52_706 [Bacteroidales bacterium]|jgi:uncharacterized protein YabE (DUF348 family)|nr:hypothetical protein [Bacteroidales bacterium]
MGSIISNDITSYRDTCLTRSKTNLISRTGTAIAITTLLTVTISNDYQEDYIQTNNTTTFEFVANKEVKKLSYKDRYQKIANSDWFVNSYKNMSLGELLSIE